MAHMETWYKCPVCNGTFYSRDEANKCAISHVYSERWAVSHKYPGKAVKVLSYRNEMQALEEAEMKD